jgi:hypothetical protein
LEQQHRLMEQLVQLQNLQQPVAPAPGSATCGPYEVKPEVPHSGVGADAGEGVGEDVRLEGLSTIGVSIGAATIGATIGASLTEEL